MFGVQRQRNVRRISAVRLALITGVRFVASIGAMATDQTRACTAENYRRIRLMTRERSHDFNYRTVHRMARKTKRLFLKKNSVYLAHGPCVFRTFHS